jgi:hypothetical protein
VSVPGGRRTIALAIVIGALAVGLLAAAWWRRGADPPDDVFVDALGEPDPELPGGLVAVDGNPGWESLPEEERERSLTPMSDAAREWLTLHREQVVSVARAFDVSPIALGGIIAAEETLLVGRMDDLGESLFLAVFGSMREKDLERWVADQERGYRSDAGAGLAPERDRVIRPYLWTLGPAQVSFRLAVRIEPRVAATMDRPRRNVKQVIEALTTVPGSLEYAAALLAESRLAYARIAGLDIGSNPGVLATVYHLGSPSLRARRLADGSGGKAGTPQVNYYGAWVNLHAYEVAGILGLPPPDSR